MVSRTTTAIEEYLLSKLNIPLLVLKLPKNMQLQRKVLGAWREQVAYVFNLEIIVNE